MPITVLNPDIAQIVLADKTVVGADNQLPVIPHGMDENGLVVPLDFTIPVRVFSANTPKRLLDDGLVKTGAGSVSGFTVGAAGTTITVSFYDGTSTGGTLFFGPYTLVAGAPIAFPGGAEFLVGLWVEFSATTGTPNITVFYR